MATIRKKKAAPPEKTISPFNQKKELRADIVRFINRYKSTVSFQAKRLSDYFEMNCFNLIVKFYELNGYTIQIKNLQKKKYKYKCSPSGLQENFSYFTIKKSEGKKCFEFDIVHNLTVQSSHNNDIYTTPDISIIKSNTILIRDDYYETKRRLCYVANQDMISFCEVKMFNPFPEILFNYIGVINELRKEIMNNTAKVSKPVHIAPSLMMSGKANKPAQKIKDELEGRYCINIFYDLHNSGISTFSRSNISIIRTTGRLVKKKSAAIF
jgi:hypothetical protein